MTSELQHTWDRFWIPLGSLDGLRTGYLPDPELVPVRLGRNETFTLDQLSAETCLILLGEPGMGKSTVFRQATDSQLSKGTPVHRVDLSQYGSEDRLVREVFENGPIEQWRNGSGCLTVVFDSFDECASRVSTLPIILASKLEAEGAGVSRLRIRIFCRAAQWPESLTDRLKTLFPSVRVLSLAPLRQRDVYTAAHDHQFPNPQSFLDEVEKRRVTAFAARPITLQMLLRLYKPSHRLPDTGAAIYEQGCLALVDECNIARCDTGMGRETASSERIQIAARIATKLVFCGRSAVYIGPEVDALSDDLGPSDCAFSPAKMREVLYTGLFTSRGGGRVAFSHETYAEYLCAFQLSQCFRDKPKQLVRLLTHPEERNLIVPKLVPIASWIASTCPQLRKVLIQTDPIALLRDDLSHWSECEKEDLVAGLLQVVEKDLAVRLRWSDRDSYRHLRHSALAAQLRPCIADRGTSYTVRREAIIMAEHARVSELSEVLTRLALDSTEDNYLRQCAARAICVAGTDNDKLLLRPLLDLRPEEDPHDELRAAALEALWPDCIPPKEFFGALQPHCHGFLGNFWSFVHGKLQNEIGLHLVPALVWAASHEMKKGSIVLDDLANHILVVATGTVHGRGVLSALAQALVGRIDRSEDLLKERDKGLRMKGDDKNLQKVTPDAESRKAILSAVVPLVGSKTLLAFAPYRLAKSQLLVQDDFPWLLDACKRASVRDRRVWLEFIRYLFQRDSLTLFTSLFHAAQENRILKMKFSAWWSVQIGSARAQKMKRAYQTYSIEEQQAAELLKPIRDYPPRARVSDCLVACETQDPAFWLSLCRDLTLTEQSRFYDDHLLAKLSVVALPGWESAESATRIRIVDAAERYLLHSGQWAPPKDRLDPNFKDMCGLLALLVLSSEDADRFQNLSLDTLQSWLPALLSTLIPDANPSAQDFVRSQIKRLHDYKPAATMTICAPAILGQLESAGCSRALEHLADCDGDELQTGLESLVPMIVSQPDALACLVWELLRRNTARAVEIVSNILSSGSSGATGRAICARVGCHLVVCNPRQAWARLWPLVERDKRLAVAVADQIGRHHSDRSFLAAYPETQLGMVAALLLRQPSKGYDARSYSYCVKSRHRLGYLLSNLLEELTSRGTQASVQELGLLCRLAPTNTHLSYCRVQAAMAALENTFPAFSPERINELVQRPTLPWARNEAELRDMVIDALEDLQREVLEDDLGSSELWSDDGRPRNEQRLSATARRHITRCIKGSSALREVEIRLGEKTPGRRTTAEVPDILVTAICASANEQVPAAVTIETKGCWHPDLLTAMETQLLGKYLTNHSSKHGIYLVGWFNCEAWSKSDHRKRKSYKGTIDELRQELDEQARRLSKGGLSVVPFVIDCSIPNPATSTRKADNAARDGRTGPAELSEAVEV